MEDNSYYREEAIEYYQNALKSGKKCLAELGESKGYLQTLASYHKTDLVGELDIGIHEIVLRKVIGTYADGRSTAFASNFMPLLDAKTEFGEKWIALCASHLAEGIHDPIKVYEYLGYYYVVEGNKRVSVLKAMDAYSIRAQVIRMIPKRTEDNDIQLLYEFLDFDKTKLFDEIWFSKPGRFTWLINKARDFAAKRQEIAEDTALDWFFACFRDFATRYREHSVTERAGCTTADAFYRYVQIYGFPYQCDYDVLNRRVKRFLPEINMINKTRDEILSDVVVTLKESDESTWSSLLHLIRKKKPSMAFVFSDNNEGNKLNHSHQVSIDEMNYRLSSNMDFLVQPCKEDDLDGAFNKLAESKPGVIFATGMKQRTSALKSCLKYPDIPILCCSPLIEGFSLSTYNARLYEGMFLLGVIAGLTTNTNHVGITCKATDSYMQICDINAFAEGVRMVNPRAAVELIYLEHNGFSRNNEEARWRLYEHNVDVYATGFLGDGPIIHKYPPEATLSLNKLGSNARIDEYLACITLSWTRFYRRIAQQLLEGVFDSYKPGNPVHYRWGIQEGLINVLTANQLFSESTMRLLALFKQLIITREIPIFETLPKDFAYKDVIDQKNFNSCIKIIADDFPERKIVS